MVNFISHASQIMLSSMLTRLQPQTDIIILEEKTGFRQYRNTI